MRERFKTYIFIIVISIIISIPLFQENFNIFLDDGIQHVCRLMGTYQSITEGQTFPVIMSNFCNEFGYSWNLFYSPLTTYIPLLFRIFSNSYVICLKMFMLLVTILSGISMYEFIYKVTKNKYAGLLGAVLYILAPYRLTDMYQRIAIAELTSFIFLPIVFQGLYMMFNDEENNKKSAALIIIVGATGLILSHTVITMYTAIIAFIYVLINIKKLKNKEIIKKLIFAVLAIVCVTCFFWLPMIEHRLATQYEVFKSGRMERTDVMIALKADTIDLLYTKKGQLGFEIGLITLLGLIFTLLAFKKVEKRYKKLYVFLLILGIVSVIMTLKWFPFEKLPSILKLLQFSFRMFEFSSFAFAVIAAINYSIVLKKFNFKDVIVLSILMVLLVVPLTKNLDYKEEKIDENILWPAIPVTQNTKRVHAGCASFEYLPSKAFENLDYIKQRENKAIVLSGSCDIENEQKNGNKMEFDVKDAKSNTVIELPYIYYLGYDIELETDNKEKISLKAYESDNGFIEIHLENGESGKVIVYYEGTILIKISMIISILSFTIIILYMVWKKEDTN